MNRKEKYTARLSLLSSLYKETKTSVFAIFLASTGDTAKTWKLVSKCYNRVINLLGKRSGLETDGKAILSFALGMAAKQKTESNGILRFNESVAVSDASAARKFFSSPEADPGIGRAFALLDVAKLSRDEASSLIGEKDLEKYQSFFDGKEGEKELLLRVVDCLCDAKDINGDLEFRAEKRYGAGHTWRIVGCCFAVALLALFIAGEAWVGYFSVLAERYSPNDDIVSAKLDYNYWRNRRNDMSKEYPNASERLVEAVDEAEDGEVFRINFLYYNEESVKDIEIDGMTVFDLYSRCYDEAAECGRIHRLIKNALAIYYEGYEVPLLPENRKVDFEPEFESFYECVKYYACEYSSLSSGFRDIFEKHYEIFGDKDALWSYVGSELFRRECAPYVNLLVCEYRMEAFRESGYDGSAEYLEAREAYEEAVFAYHNPSGYISGYLPSAVALDDERGSYYTSLLTEFGLKIEEKTAQEVRSIFTDEAMELVRDDMEDADCGAYSANLTKEQITGLYGDARFTLLGVALPSVPKSYPDGMDSALAYLITEGRDKYKVFRVDDNKWMFFTNYLVPISLPKGLVESVREREGSRDTAYELLLGYNFRYRYGHEDTLTRAQVFRKLRVEGNFYYCSNEGKYYQSFIPVV